MSLSDAEKDRLDIAVDLDAEGNDLRHLDEAVEAIFTERTRSLATRWATVADLCNEEGIETPTFPIRTAVADLLGLLGDESSDG